MLLTEMLKLTRNDMMRSNNCDDRIVGGSTAVAEDKDNKDHGRNWEE